MIKKNNLYYPSKEIQKQAWVKNNSIYKESLKNPIKFWQKAAGELHWFKKWSKTFEHKPPYFSWFKGGKLNITYNSLDRNLEKNKNKAAIIWEPESVNERSRILTYYQLSKEVNKFANVLKGIGVKKGDRVGIYLPMIPETMIAMLACARIGAIHAVVFSAFSPKALRVRLQDTGSKVLITSDGYYRRGKTVDLKKAADEGVKDTNVKKVVVVKRTKNETTMKKDRDFWWDELMSGQSDECAPEAMDSEDAQFILYTSGSTGKPKGVVHTCGGYMVQSYMTSKLIFDIKDSDIFWSTADVGWITGHTYSCYGPLLNGATFLIFEGAPNFPSPDRWCQIIEEYGVSIFYTAPTAIRMFAKELGTVSNYKFKTLRLLGSVGEPINESAWNWFYKEVGKERCPLLDTWWQTETGGILITSLPGIGPFRPTYTGVPFPGIKVDILDDKGKSLPSEKPGNLVILPPFAPGILRGVYKNHKKYLKTYWSEYGNKIYYTSDGAYKDKKGLIRIVGRMDDVIKVAGHRLSTGELENVLCHNKKVSECAVIGVADEIKGEVPVAFVILKSGKGDDALKKELVLDARKGIGPTALPKEIYFARDLPKTRSGKIMRRILRKLFTGEDLGDLSTLANEETVEEVRKLI